MAGSVITEKQSALLNAIVSDLAAQAEADAVYMSDCTGNIIAHVSRSTGSGAVQNIAALAAGSFSATRELAGLIGEPAFYSILHKGQHSSIYIHSITSDFLVLVVFGGGTTPGLVKLYVEKACREMEPILLEMAGQAAAGMGSAARAFELDPEAQLFKKKGARTGKAQS